MNKYVISAELQKKAEQVLVGGVNSPVRSFKAVQMDPVFIQSAKGSKITDADGNTYIDYVAAYGPAILGHSDADVVKAVYDASQNGFGYGASTQQEIILAELILEAYNSYDKIRFVNSGTEAVMSAIRLARGVTGKSKIIKFSGCYHGHMDALLVAAGSGIATLALPDSAGITKEAAQNTIVVPFNNHLAVDQAFHTFKDQIAAVIVEPVAGNMGLVLPQKGFLQQLRTLCNENEALLISDEIMCGFRKSYASVMSSLDVQADITCLGKIIGGGLPVGAYLAQSSIIDHIAPLGPVYQAGTMSGNPIVMAAGIATLRKINKPGFYSKLTENTTQLCKAINRKGLVANQFGSMLSLFFTDKSPQNFRDVQNTKSDLYTAFFRKVLQKGLFVPPSPYETWFVSAAHSKQDIKDTITVLEESL